MGFCVYILWSEELGKYYVGSTNDFDDRLFRHNQGYEKFTSKGIPWKFVWKEYYSTRSEAYYKEIRIKKRGIKRFLIDLEIGK
jgi:putative endonuclease